MEERFISFEEKVVLWIRRYNKQLMLAVGSLCLVGAAYASHLWYRSYQESKAHAAYCQAQLLEKARILGPDETAPLFETVFATVEEKEAAVIRHYKEVYEQYPHTGMGVISGMSYTHHLIKNKKIAEAREVMKILVSRIPSEPVRRLYTVTLGQLLLDSTDENEKNEGIAVLEKLAFSSYEVRDLALYRLGEYYWYTDNYDKAQHYWQQLVLYHKQAPDTPGSYWAQKAEEKLLLVRSSSL